LKKISEIMPSIKIPSVDNLRDNIKEIMDPVPMDELGNGSSPTRLTYSKLEPYEFGSALEPGVDYYMAMLKSQSEFPDVDQSKTFYSGDKYSTLKDVLKAVRPILNANGIFLEQNHVYNKDKDQCITTKLIHGPTGQGSEFTTMIPFHPSDFEGNIAFQVYGSGFTYFKRYILGSKFGLFTDEDTDGVVGGKTKEEKKAYYDPKPKDSKPSVAKQEAFTKDPPLSPYF